MQALSVRGIADRVRRPHEEMGTVVDRIRGWSDVGLIKVAGTKFPGTGRKRRYGPEAIIDALILTALTDAGLAAVRVGHFQGVDGQTVLGFGRMGAAAVFDPKNARTKIYLVIAGSPRASAHTTYLAFATPERTEIDLSDLSKPAPVPARTTEDVRLPPDAIWSVVLHLNEVFRSLRGVVSATLKDGFVKVAFIENTEKK
jgi:hypothetical protein